MANLSITVRNVGAPEQAKTQALIYCCPNARPYQSHSKPLTSNLMGLSPQRLSRAISPVQQGRIGGYQARKRSARSPVDVVMPEMSVATAKKISEGLAKTLVAARLKSLNRSAGFQIGSISQLMSKSACSYRWHTINTPTL